MAILDTYAPRYAISNRVRKDGYSGNYALIRRDDGNPATDSTQLIGYVGTSEGDAVDMDALNTFLGTSDGYVVEVYGQEGNTFVQTDPTLQPRIDFETDDDGICLIGSPYEENWKLLVENSLTNGTHTAYVVGKPSASVDTTQAASFQFTERSGTFRLGFRMYNFSPDLNLDGNLYLYFAASTTSSAKVLYTPTDNDLLVGIFDASQSASWIYQNRTALLENSPTVGSVSGEGYSIGQVGNTGVQFFVGTMLYYPSAHDDTTRQAIEDALLPQQVKVPKVTFRDEVGSPIVGGTVRFFTRDPAPATTPELQSLEWVGSDYITDANGEATYDPSGVDPAVDPDKIYGAYAIHSKYENGQWLQAEGADSGQQNVDLTPPA